MAAAATAAFFVTAEVFLEVLDGFWEEGVVVLSSGEGGVMLGSSRKDLEIVKTAVLRRRYWGGVHCGGSGSGSGSISGRGVGLRRGWEMPEAVAAVAVVCRGRQDEAAIISKRRCCGAAAAAALFVVASPASLSEVLEVLGGFWEEGVVLASGEEGVMLGSAEPRKYRYCGGSGSGSGGGGVGERCGSALVTAAVAVAVAVCRGHQDEVAIIKTMLRRRIAGGFGGGSGGGSGSGVGTRRGWGSARAAVAVCRGRQDRVAIIKRVLCRRRRR